MWKLIAQALCVKMISWEGCQCWKKHIYVEKQNLILTLKLEVKVTVLNPSINIILHSLIQYWCLNNYTAKQELYHHSRWVFQTYIVVKNGGVYSSW